MSARMPTMLSEMRKRGRPSRNSDALERSRLRAATAVLVCNRSVTDVAWTYRVTTRSVRRWVAAYRKHGADGIRAKRRTTAPRTLTACERRLLLERMAEGPTANGYYPNVYWSRRLLGYLVRRLFGSPRDTDWIPEGLKYYKSISRWNGILPRPPDPIGKHAGPYGLGVPTDERRRCIVTLGENLLDRHISELLAESGLKDMAIAVHFLCNGYPPKLVAKHAGVELKAMLRQYRRFLKTGTLLPHGMSRVGIRSATVREEVLKRRSEGASVSSIASYYGIKHCLSWAMVRKYLNDSGMGERRSPSQRERWRKSHYPWR